MANFGFVLMFSFLLAMGSLSNVQSLDVNYYSRSCPSAKATIARLVNAAVKKNKRVGAGMVRLFFHDCFVEGCDASVLVKGTNTEIDAIPNQTLHNLDLIDSIKAALESACPRTVSCADIIAYTAYNSVKALGGTAFDPEGGRFDGLVSLTSEANSQIPSPFSPLSTLKTMFASKGLNVNDLVVLSGAHSIGKAHCGAFSNRLYNFSSTANTDPTLNAKYAASLKKTCPVNPPSTTIVNMDTFTPTTLDDKYYVDVQTGKGLFTSDAALYTSPTTKTLVDRYARNNAIFESQFASSLFKMGQVGLKTSSNGNIRKLCTAFN